jgi:transcriptional regulator with XRE-family HTH domain
VICFDHLMPLKTDGARLRELRERNLLTQAQFAKRIGYNPDYVGNVECGRENAGPRFLKAAVVVLGCAIEDITDGVIPRRTAERAEASS